MYERILHVGNHGNTNSFVIKEAVHGLFKIDWQKKPLTANAICVFAVCPPVNRKKLLTSPDRCG